MFVSNRTLTRAKKTKTHWEMTFVYKFRYFFAFILFFFIILIKQNEIFSASVLSDLSVSPHVVLISMNFFPRFLSDFSFSKIFY